MLSKKLLDIVALFDEDIDELADKISLTLMEKGLSHDEYYIVRHKIMANLRESCKYGERD